MSQRSGDEIAAVSPLLHFSTSPLLHFLGYAGKQFSAGQPGGYDRLLARPDRHAVGFPLPD